MRWLQTMYVLTRWRHRIAIVRSFKCMSTDRVLKCYYRPMSIPRRNLGHIAGPGPQCPQAQIVDQKCLQVPNLLIEANAVRNRVFIERNFNWMQRLKGAVCRALGTNAKSQEGREGGLGVFNLLTPLRNLTTRSCFPTDLPSTGSWWEKIAVT